MKSLSYRWQLPLFILMICGVTLSLAMVGLYLYQRQQFSVEIQSRLEKTQLLMVGNLAPLLEQNPEATDLQLGALGVDSQIAAAAVFTPDGKLLARYVRFGAHEVVPPPSKNLTKTAFDIHRGVWTPITSGTNRTLGLLYLKAEESEADKQRFTDLLKLAGIIFASAAFLAISVAFRLGGRFTAPITELAQVASSVQRTHDYGQRRDRGIDRVLQRHAGDD